jgi:hypothetical protein
METGDKKTLLEYLAAVAKKKATVVGAFAYLGSA